MFVFGEISHIGEKNKTLANPTKSFLGFVFLNHYVLRKRKLNITIFRQCVVPIGHQN